MKKIILIIYLLFIIDVASVFSRAGEDTTVYLLTCGPGTETYSIYGHSALRIVIPGKNIDIVYNWGVFDFSTPNFTWKFAKGRLDYMLGIETMPRFIQGYFYEERYVISQKINLESAEIDKLFVLITENLRPENVKYRYDFFYDDCSTRIRDLIEKSVGDKLLYPPDGTVKTSSFRDMVGKYQSGFPWLQFGIDLIMGSPGDKKASIRDQMFLPIDLKDVLSATVINRSGKMIPLLQNPEVILDYAPPEIQGNFFLTPVFLFSLLLIIVIMVTASIRGKKANKLIDLIVFSIFSIFSALMIFFNFFTDHVQMKWNLNILWLNPVIWLCLIIIIFNKQGVIWFRTLFFISGAFFLIHWLLPQEFNISFLLLVLVIMLRSSARADFEWNPFLVK